MLHFAVKNNKCNSFCTSTHPKHLHIAWYSGTILSLKGLYRHLFSTYFPESHKRKYVRSWRWSYESNSICFSSGSYARIIQRFLMKSCSRITSVKKKTLAKKQEKRNWKKWKNFCSKETMRSVSLTGEKIIFGFQLMWLQWFLCVWDRSWLHEMNFSLLTPLC